MKKLLFLLLFPVLATSQNQPVKADTAKSLPEKKQVVKSRRKALETIEAYRQQVIEGKSTMRVLAGLYSEDPGSSSKGGLYENVLPGLMDPAFEKVAYSLKPGEISGVFETRYGYHIIELVNRRGDTLDLRHLLIMTNQAVLGFK